MCLRALCMHAWLNDHIRGVVSMESSYINLLFLYRFEAIFNQCFNATYTIDTELMWHHVSELQANFKAPTYEVLGGALALVDKKHVGSHPKMFLFTLDELSYVYQHVHNTDALCIIAYEMLSFASDRCMGLCNGRPKPETSLERLTWAVYDGMYVPGSQPALSGPCNWACILDKMMTHIFHGRMLWEHCPPAPLEVPMQPLLPT